MTTDSQSAPPSNQGSPKNTTRIGEFDLRTILVPTDLTPVSEVAIRFGKALAKQTGARLILLNVVEKIHQWKDFGYGVVDWGKENHQILEENRKKIEGLQCQLGEECIVCHAEVKSGDPAFEIARAADTLEADLIVLTTHHLADVPGREPKASLAESIVRRARKPVLLLPIIEKPRISLDS